MPTVIMPKMGDGMEEGTLLRWLKEVGQEVAEGEPLAEIETDKVSLEIEATEAGVLTKTLVGEGDTVPIGSPIATIGEEAAEAPAAAAPAPEASAPDRSSASGTNGRAPTADDAPEDERMFTPAARRGDADGAALDAVAQASGEGVGATGAPDVAGGAALAAAAASTAPARAAGERLRASPLVKRLAAEHGIDLQGVVGTGPG
ncbi:MAG: Dihydrolipoamide acetyltransferase component of pyruvate dehydrogenase complex, partial [uncultured Thermomicrobiales bacterium]